MKKKTKLIHGGIVGDEQTGAVSTPIYQVSTYKQNGVGNFKYEYSRTGNPTREALEALIRDLEGGYAGFAFSSGMAAISAVMTLFNSGSHIIVTDDVYGGTYRLMSKIINRSGIDVTFIDTSNPKEVTDEIQENTVAIFIETPTNPLLKITDIRSIGEIARKHSLLFIVDNTFSTPYWQNPMTLGADIVLHSATKYLGGHSDVVAGVAVVKNEKLAKEMHFIQNSVGGILGPHDSWLLMRGMKTLGLRMEQTEKTAKAIVQFLETRNDINTIYYPGLSSHRGHQTHVNQSNGFGGMISFDVGSGKRAQEVLQKTKLFTLAESLGAVESLISLPAKMTHASIPKERRKELGITDGLIRISVGIEDTEDLLVDLRDALDIE
ncbi:bifunctional cystathionine gamma-lyase/homocysteine desulfhydrase [Evansella sp. AB-P1]|uniref:bifunctional cystathionine gamma-lyase/homocysteine desulfhydrase n=1 Tax=Evansella sp. AB-P1 TaxID=3037653 RepID=UPI00241D9E2C|nr:bifunctional cystathionine gamma-lyase/homocysteine desulfhydrase [Evansella sp. AB-P1]MDG5789517.1 bifunctional cystathionine gamma-lyase/homocysteine desulfhydrase [Evansella sp. AB-P1]